MLAMLERMRLLNGYLTVAGAFISSRGRSLVTEETMFGLVTDTTSSGSGSGTGSGSG
jgi:hypothetical protein